jgi:hypothetical protein
MNTGKNNTGKAGKKENKAANTTAPATTPAAPATNVETTNKATDTDGETAPATSGENAPATSGENAPATSGENAPATSGETAPATTAATAPKQKARIPLKGVSRRGGGGGGGKSLGTVYNIAEVMYGHITTKTVKNAEGVSEKITATMHHIINGEATFVTENDEVMIDFAPAGPKLYSFVANVNNKTDRKTSIYKEVEGDVEVLDAKGEPVLNEDKTPKTVKGMVPAPGCAWHGFIVATPANAQKVYNNIKAMLTNPLTEGSVLREQITLLEPPFNLHSGAAATLDLTTEEEVVEGENEEEVVEEA